MGGNVMAGKTLTIVLAADISRLSKGLRSAQGDLGQFNNSADGSSRSLGLLGGAMIAAGAAAAAMAIKFGVDSVKAFAEDEASANKLAKTLGNLGLAHDTTKVENYIGSLEMSAAVADDVLRPAYSRLVRALGDTAQASSALQLALDIAAGTGKSVEAVTNALGKAYEGNFTALGKLGTGIDKATLKSGDLKEITKQLSETFSGQATTAAETTQGSLNKLGIAAGNLQEAFGRGLVKAFGDASGSVSGFAKQINNMQPEVEGLGLITGRVAQGGLGFFGTVLQGMTSQGGVLWAFGKLIGVDTAAVDEFSGALNRVPFAQSVYWLEHYGQGLGIMNDYGRAAFIQAENLATAFNNQNTSLTGTSKAIKINTDALDLQSAALDVNKTKLSAATDQLKTAQQAYTDFWKNTQSQITQGIDLAAAFDLSQTTGQSIDEILGAQIGQLDWYGTILRELNAAGANEALMAAITSNSPEIGAKIGEDIILKGLVPTLNAQYDYLKTTSEFIAKAIVPIGKVTGIDTAINTVQGLAAQVEKDQDKYKAIGKSIGKPIGAQAADEIAKLISAAWRDIEEAKTAAAAAAAAAATTRRVVVSDQQAVQNLWQVLNNSNARAGYQESVVIG